MIPYEKCVSDIIQLVPTEIVSFVEQNGIDAIVNAANPTLMGSNNSSVDYSIHQKIDDILQPINKTFNKIIKDTTDHKKNLPNETIRCRRGQAVVTAGGKKNHKLCKYVIHVVGTEYDGMIDVGVSQRMTPFCSSSCIQNLESCYQNIVNEIRKHPDIKKIAIPIVSSGNYGFPYETAVRVALASIGNALMDWRKRDTELFNQSTIEKIYICIYDKNDAIQADRYRLAGKVWKSYEKILRYDHKVVVQNTWMAHCRYIREIWKYDKNRGYFAIARNFRLLLMILRIVFLPVLLIKDFLGGYNWENRRAVVEAIVILKMLLPFSFYLIINERGYSPALAAFLQSLLLYFMVDTVTYLLVLIVLSDIQRPSANVIRSMIFLFINYLEVSADIAILYYLNNFGHVSILQVVQFGIGTDGVLSNNFSNINMLLHYANSGIKFFFVSLAFGYFANHLHQRKFIS